MEKCGMVKYISVMVLLTQCRGRDTEKNNENITVDKVRNICQGRVLLLELTIEAVKYWWSIYIALTMIIMDLLQTYS